VLHFAALDVDCGIAAAHLQSWHFAVTAMSR